MDRNPKETSESENSEDFARFPQACPAGTLDSEVFKRCVERYAKKNTMSTHEAIVEIAGKALIDPKTLAKWLDGTTKRPNAKTVRQVSAKLELQPGESLLVPSSKPVTEVTMRPAAAVANGKADVPVRDISGHWHFLGIDVNSPPHLTFQGEPKITYGEFDITMTPPSHFTGRGRDKDQDILELRGELLGEGTFLRGTYDLLHPSLMSRGVFFLRLSESANMMFGGGIQRETGQEARYNMILLHIVLSRDPIDKNYFEPKRSGRRKKK